MRQSSAVAFRAPVLIPPSEWLSMEEAAILDGEIAEDHIALDKAEMEVVRLTDVQDSLGDVQAILQEAPNELVANQQLVEAVGVMAACGDEAVVELGQIAAEDFKEDLGNKLAKLWAAIKAAIAKMWEHLKALTKKLRLKFSATYRHQEELRKKWEEYEAKAEQWKKDNEALWKRYNEIQQRSFQFSYKGDVSKLVPMFSKPGTIITNVPRGVESLVNDVILLRQHLIGTFTHMGRLIDQEVSDYLNRPYVGDDRFRKSFVEIVKHLLDNAKGMTNVDTVTGKTITTKALHLGGIAITIAEGTGSWLWKVAGVDTTMSQMLNFDLKVERNDPGSMGSETQAKAITSEGKDIVLKASNKWWEAMSSATSIAEMERLEETSKKIDKHLDALVARANDTKRSDEVTRHANDLIKAANLYARLVVKILPKLTSHVDDVVDASLSLADRSLVHISQSVEELAQLGKQPAHPVEPSEKPKKR